MLAQSISHAQCTPPQASTMRVRFMGGHTGTGSGSVPSFGGVGGRYGGGSSSPSDGGKGGDRGGGAAARERKRPEAMSGHPAHDPRMSVP